MRFDGSRPSKTPPYLKDLPHRLIVTLSHQSNPMAEQSVHATRLPQVYKGLRIIKWWQSFPCLPPDSEGCWKLAYTGGSTKYGVPGPPCSKNSTQTLNPALHIRLMCLDICERFDMFFRVADTAWFCCCVAFNDQSRGCQLKAYVDL
jgi:hypothetical protein